MWSFKNHRNIPTIWFQHITILLNSLNYMQRIHQFWMNFILFAPFKSQVFSHNSVQLFQIVGIFLQFDSVQIFQIVGIFLQFSSIHKFQTVGIFLQFGQIHIKITLFKSYNHRNFPSHIFQIVGIFLQFNSVHIKLSHFSNRRYVPTI